MTDSELIILQVRPGDAMESQSGLQTNWPRIYGALHGPRTAAESRTKVALVVIHPTSNFMNHYLLAPLAERGLTVLGLNTRYLNNDSLLIMERAIQDLGAGVRFLRERGFEKVYLIGNSGGAALVTLYQAEAERQTITDTPAGDPITLYSEEMPPADGIILAAAHLGRSWLITNWLDASLIDERDPLSVDPQLDIYDERNGPPFTPEFLTQLRAEQRARNQRITHWAHRRLHYLRSMSGDTRDEAFIVYRTYADPVFLDGTIDPNDRRGGGNKGNPRAVNYGPNNLARFCTLTSWLSQWSLESRAYGPDCLRRTSVPLLHLEYTADGSILPAHVREWNEAGKERIEHRRIRGANHYLKGQPELVDEVADHINAWVTRST
ncbi:MAG: alpha/beta hydrolase [Pigmentiphaga sp.]